MTAVSVALQSVASYELSRPVRMRA